MHGYLHISFVQDMSCSSTQLDVCCNSLTLTFPAATTVHYQTQSPCMQSIRRAHANVKPGKLHVNKGELLGANANRSPSAYLHNPEEERARYQHDTDKIMTQLSVTNSEGKGTFAHTLWTSDIWFADANASMHVCHHSASYRYWNWVGTYGSV